MNNIFKLIASAVVIGAFCTIHVIAQGNEKAVSPIKGVGVVIKHGGASRVTFCWSPDDNTATSYKLKVWQLMKGQTVETAMRSNPPIVTKDVDIADTTATAKHAINTKGAGSGDRTSTTESDLDLIKVCSEALQQGDSSTAKHAINTKGAGANDKVGVSKNIAVLIADSIACAPGNSCNFVWTVEPRTTNSRTATIS